MTPQSRTVLFTLSAALLMSAIFLSGVFPVQAETTADNNKESKETIDEASLMEEVLVKESKHYPELLHDSATAGSVLLRADFDDASTTLTETLDRQAGIRTTRSGGTAAFSTLSIRGSTADQVQVFIDGINLNSAGGGPVDISRIPLGNISRIEIYRGAAPIIFGGNSIGGVLSINTLEAQGRELQISAGGGSFGERRTSLYFSEEQPRWNLALGLDYSGQEGSFTYTNDNGTRFDNSDDRTISRKNNDYNQINLLFKNRYKLPSALCDLSLTVLDWFFYREQGVAGLGQFETQEASSRIIDNMSALKLDAVGLAEVLDWSLLAAFRYSNTQFADPLEEIGLSGTGVEDNSYSPSLKSYYSAAIREWLNWNGQQSYRYEQIAPSENSLAAAQSERHFASFSQEPEFIIKRADLRIVPSATVESVYNRLDINNAVTGTASSSNVDDLAISYRLALVNESIPDTRLLINGGSTARFPSLFELFGNNGKVLGNPDLNKEQAYNAEAGAIYESSMLPYPYRLRLELFGFFSEVHNLIQFVQSAQNISIAENVDSARIWGLEGGLRSDLFGHLRLAANYTYMNTRNTGNLAAREGKRLPMRPASQWYARAEAYFVRISEFDEISFYAETEWTAGNFLDNANLVATGSRFHVNSGFAFDLGGVKLSFAANNLSGEQTEDLTGYPLPGRSFHFDITWKIL